MTIVNYQYSGDKALNQIIHNSSFIANFTSDNNYRFLGFNVFWSCVTVLNQTGSHGSLYLNQDKKMQNIIWKIESNCSAVQVDSLYFDTIAGKDLLDIAAQEYSGSPLINQIILGSSFVATFRSDGNSERSAFNVSWSCFVDHYGNYG